MEEEYDNEGKVCSIIEQQIVYHYTLFYVLQHLNKWDKKWMRNGQYTTNHIRINTKEKR